jgi:serine/threonine protein kinase
VANERDLLSEVLTGYELGEEIGRGGWGVVFDAEHRTLGRRVAIKYLPAAFSGDPDARSRFRSEARVVASLDHPHIVPLYDFVEQGDTCVFVMELMPGGTLWDRFEGGDLTPEAACNVTLALLGALYHAHQRGVLHRDVKPENVLFNKEGMPKLADFGIAKVLGDGAGTRTATGMIMGTPAYMAPEQGSGEPVSPATDVYAIGAMLYELLSGRLPFESTGNALAQLYRHVHEAPTPLTEIAPQVPDGVAAVVMKALEKKPEDRFGDAATFAGELNAQATGSFGDDWSSRTNIPVLATRAVLGTTVGRSLDPRDGESAEPEAHAVYPPPQTVQPPPDPSPQAPAATYEPPAPSIQALPSTQQGAGQLASYQPTAAEPARPHAPTTSPTPTKRSRTGLLVGGGIAGVAAVVAAGVLFLGGNGESPGDDEEPTIPAAATARFQEACRINGVDDELCTCALERSLDELTAQEFLANDQLLRESGDELLLTAPVVERFDTCRDELQGSGDSAA